MTTIKCTALRNKNINKRLNDNKDARENLPEWTFSVEERWRGHLKGGDLLVTGVCERGIRLLTFNLSSGFNKFAQFVGIALFVVTFTSFSLLQGPSVAWSVSETSQLILSLVIWKLYPRKYFGYCTYYNFFFFFQIPQMVKNGRHLTMV